MQLNRGWKVPAYKWHPRRHENYSLELSGFGETLTIHTLKGICKSQSPEIMFISETKNQSRQVKIKLQAFSYENWHIVNPSGMAGGLALAWKDSINVQIINSGEFFVAAEVKEFGNNGVWTFIGVHLGCSKQIRALQFEELTTMSQQLEGKVVIAGDFNAIISQVEKEGGGQKSATTIATFINFIDSNELVDTRMVGRPFTWTNRRQEEDLVKERLDHYLVGIGWKLKFPNAVVHRLTKSGSDHAPILMETEPQSWHSKRHFKY
ncbi:uncharacterized protein [Arachis hypogaea]|uniref:uncharacterized protein n=1 Tax=Arachis hypogaea TaxID=3818 RepID=UPI003B225962